MLTMGPHIQTGNIGGTIPQQRETSRCETGKKERCVSAGIESPDRQCIQEKDAHTLYTYINTAPTRTHGLYIHPAPPKQKLRDLTSPRLPTPTPSMVHGLHTHPRLPTPLTLRITRLQLIEPPLLRLPPRPRRLPARMWRPDAHRQRSSSITLHVVVVGPAQLLRPGPTLHGGCLAEFGADGGD